MDDDLPDLSDRIAARRRLRRAETGVENTVARIQYENMLAGIDARLARLRAKKQEFARGSGEYLRIDEDIVSAELDWFRLAEYCEASTAIHEAGHCVMHVVLGERLAECHIEEKQIAGRSIWLGVATPADNSKWASMPHSDPYDDLDRAAIVFAGVAAEMLFLKDYRQGSSLDELALFQMLCCNSANKLGLLPVHMIGFVHENVCGILTHHKHEHHSISEALLELKSLDANELAALTASIVPMGRHAWKPALANVPRRPGNEHRRPMDRYKLQRCN